MEKENHGCGGAVVIYLVCTCIVEVLLQWMDSSKSAEHQQNESFWLISAFIAFFIALFLWVNVYEPYRKAQAESARKKRDALQQRFYAKERAKREPKINAGSAKREKTKRASKKRSLPELSMDKEKVSSAKELDVLQEKLDEAKESLLELDILYMRKFGYAKIFNDPSELPGEGAWCDVGRAFFYNDSSFLPNYNESMSHFGRALIYSDTGPLFDIDNESKELFYLGMALLRFDEQPLHDIPYHRYHYALLGFAILRNDPSHLPDNGSIDTWGLKAW